MEATAVTIDNHPLWVNLEPAFQVLEGYEQAELDRKVFACFAGYANSQGVCDPLQKTIAEKLGETAMNVCRSVHRLVDKCLISIPRKEKKYNDIHPRNITQINKALLRKEPDKLSSHFDAEKWRVIAARLKKFVSDAVDEVKQVAVSAAKNMSNAKKRKRKQWKQSQNSSSDTNTPYYSYQNMRAAYPTVEESVEPTPKPSPVDRRIQDMLFEKGFQVTDPAFTKIGFWMLDRLTEKSKPEDYDAMFQQAVEKLAITLPRVSHPAGNRSHLDAARDARLMSPDDEPKTLGNVLGGASA